MQMIQTKVKIPPVEPGAEAEEKVGPAPFELAVPPEPSPPFVSTYAGIVPEPPGRATLYPLPKATPLSISAAKHRLELTGASAADNDDDEPVLMKVAISEKVAMETNAFIKQLSDDKRYVGIAAFVVFALRYRLRVFLWHGTESCNVLQQFAPWAVDHIETPAVGLVTGISCRINEKGALVSHGDALHRMNHWVGGLLDPAFYEGDVPSGPSEEVLNKTEEELEFHAMYLSMHINIIETCRDGDCGLDVMCVMGGRPRGIVPRQAIRGDLAAFVHKHRENKALLHMLKGLGELTGLEDLGEMNLSADAARLMDPL